MSTVADIKRAIEGLSDDWEVIVQNCNTGAMYTVDGVYSGRQLIDIDTEGDEILSDEFYLWLDLGSEFEGA